MLFKTKIHYYTDKPMEVYSDADHSPSFAHLYTDARKIYNAYLCFMAAILKNGRHF